MRQHLIAGAGLAAVALTMACNLTALSQPEEPTPTVATTQPPTAEPSPTPPPTPTLYPTGTPDDPNWDDPAPGVERRDVTVIEPRSGEWVKWHMVRLDPSRIDFKVHYQPGYSNTIVGWQIENSALVVVNGGFFSSDFRNQGITIVKGEEFTNSPGYEDDVGVGGLFAVKDGQVSIVPLDREPAPSGTYDFDYATEGYPMLLNEGGTPAFEQETGNAAERTVVALDERGRVIFILSRSDLFTLYGLSHALANLEEPDLDVALNLDGGTSSGMVIRAGSEFTRWYPVTELPIVIAAYPKEEAPNE